MSVSRYSSFVILIKHVLSSLGETLRAFLKSTNPFDLPPLRLVVQFLSMQSQQLLLCHHTSLWKCFRNCAALVVVDVVANSKFICAAQLHGNRTLWNTSTMLVIQSAAFLIATLVISECWSVHPHRPPLPPSSHIFSPLGIGACLDAFGSECEMCCGGKCCEDVSESPRLPEDQYYLFHLRFVLIVDDQNTQNRTLSPRDVDAQKDVLNAAFNVTRFRFSANSSLAVAKTNFTRDSLVIINNTHLATHCSTDLCYAHPDVCVFNKELLPAVDAKGNGDITIIVCDDISYDGESQFPWAAPEASQLHYIQVRYGALLGKGAGTTRNLGKSLVHEMGHYFGLLHTFEGGCFGAGDYVDDTPPSAHAANKLDTCPSLSDVSSCHFPTPDDRRNFMDYAADECVDHFTLGQIERMEKALRKYRPQLLSLAAASWQTLNPTTRRGSLALVDIYGIALVATFAAFMLVALVHRNAGYATIAEIPAARSFKFRNRHPQDLATDPS